MPPTYEFYQERADAAAAAAKVATLDNVRERELRSAKTWRRLAEQAKAAAVSRKKADQEREERRAAEDAAGNLQIDIVSFSNRDLVR